MHPGNCFLIIMAGPFPAADYAALHSHINRTKWDISALAGTVIISETLAHYNLGVIWPIMRPFAFKSQF